MWLKFSSNNQNRRKHHDSYLFAVYHNPDDDDSTLYWLLVSMVAIQENDGRASFVFIGDFDAHHREWLNSISQTDCHGCKSNNFSSGLGCDKIIHDPTLRSGKCLDLISRDTPGVVTGNVGSSFWNLWPLICISYNHNWTSCAWYFIIS